MGTKKTGLDVKNYCFRIEFQMRGMPHIHGVLWLQGDDIQKCLVDKDSYEFDTDKVPDFIDTIISCSSEGEDLEVNKIVNEVQKHHHIRSCQKKNNVCRFGFPKPPSDETIIAKPDKDINKKEMKKYKEIMTKVKQKLESPDLNENMDLKSFLKDLDIKPDDYKKALQISERGQTVILKRTLKDRYINNFNPNFIKAWDANLDIQFCCDTYAVLCYITDYYSKDESGVTEDLKLALKDAQQKGMGQKAMMHHLKRAYMSKRQIGLSEAIYRMIPDLHLRDSNISTKFVASGFPENLSTFMRKVHNEDDEMDSSDDEATVHIEGRTGLYKQSTSDIEKYKNRPWINEGKDWNITLAQFATSYVSCAKKPENIIWNGDMSEQLGMIKNYVDGQLLPKYIRFSVKKKTYILRLRTYAAIMKMHSSSKKSGYEEFYAEMQLFYPWRCEETDLFYGRYLWPNGILIMFSNN